MTISQRAVGARGRMRRGLHRPLLRLPREARGAVGDRAAPADLREGSPRPGRPSGDASRSTHPICSPSFPAGYRHLAYAQTQIGYEVKRDMPGLVGPGVAAALSPRRRVARRRRSRRSAEDGRLNRPRAQVAAVLGAAGRRHGARRREPPPRGRRHRPADRPDPIGHRPVQRGRRRARGAAGAVLRRARAARAATCAAVRSAADRRRRARPAPARPARPAAAGHRISVRRHGDRRHRDRDRERAAAGPGPAATSPSKSASSPGCTAPR